jgi:hypothetical protein
MHINKPFHRNIRGIVTGPDRPNAGYSSVGYVIDGGYAVSPERYTKAFLVLQADLLKLFEFVEPSDESRKAHSYRIHELLMRTCLEVEANFDAILRENICTAESFYMPIYRKINVTHHLSSYKVSLPIWQREAWEMRPFADWEANKSPEWYTVCNPGNYARRDGFHPANLEQLISAFAGLLVVLTSQFGQEDFLAPGNSHGIDGYEYREMEPAIGSLFRIERPSDWTDEEKYDFNWSTLQNESVRFQKFDYDKI